MGRRISRIVKETPGAELSLIIDRQDTPEDPGDFANARITTDNTEVSSVDVVIDFSAPGQAISVLKECAKSGTGVVIGTTGFTSGQKDEITELASATPVLLSPNMSIGVNLIFKLARIITESLPGFDREVVEAHHNRKADAPSGTALRIAEIMAREGEELLKGRTPDSGPRKPSQVGVHAVRGGGIVGEHTAMWIGEDERIELFHRAETRDIFASGAVRAALWLHGRSPGKLYTMEDVLS